MAYGKSKTEQRLNEGELFIGVVTDPSTIGDGSTGNPKDLFTGESLGFIKQGTLNPTLARQLSMLYSDTPSELVRVDLIQKDWSVECELTQYNADILKLTTQAFAQIGYTNGSYIGDLIHIGTEEDVCSQDVFFALMLLTQRVDCKEIGMLWYSAINTTESISFQVSQEHGSIAFKAMSTPDPDFSTDYPDTTKNQGLIWITQQAA